MKNMNLLRSLPLACVLAVGLVPLAAIRAHDGPHAAKAAGELIPVTDKDAAWASKAKAEYPTRSCVVSEDKLDSNEMGKPVDYIYRQAGHPDRLIRFCCKDCAAEFSKEPAKYLKVLDDPAATKKLDAAKS